MYVFNAITLAESDFAGRIQFVMHKLTLRRAGDEFGRRERRALAGAHQQSVGSRTGRGVCLCSKSPVPRTFRTKRMRHEDRNGKAPGRADIPGMSPNAEIRW
jgi:hypothetical protein